LALLWLAGRGLNFEKNLMEEEDVALGEHRVAFAEIARLLRDVTSGQVTLTRKVSAYTCFVLVSLMYQHR
jgi:hypothetical protein